MGRVSQVNTASVPLSTLHAHATATTSEHAAEKDAQCCPFEAHVEAHGAAVAALGRELHAASALKPLLGAVVQVHKGYIQGGRVPETVAQQQVGKLVMVLWQTHASNIRL